MKALILAGGGGTRLWPLSRENYPKQFLRLNGDKSLLRQTIDRVLNAVSPDDVIILTNGKYLFYVKAEAPEINNIVLEPASRNTAPAVALGIKYCMEKLGCKESEAIFLSPSDHIIKPFEAFGDYMRRAEQISEEGFIVTFGIKPNKPETGYGYIKTSMPQSAVSGQQYLKVERFTEKPDLEAAKRFVNEGVYYWNSGMFAFKIKTMLDELNNHAAGIRSRLDADYESAMAGFEDMPDISIDYAVMEKSQNIALLPMELYWSDIGSWDSLYDVLDKDDKGNVSQGNVLSIDTKRTMIMGNKRLIAAIGLEDIIIVETDDAVLIAKRDESQKVKDIVSGLKRNNCKEAVEHITTYRPWGSYTVLEEGPRYKIKRIVVNPLEKLSLQMHYHRSEHWVVIKGAAKVYIDGKEIFIHENESAYVPKSTHHRLENPGKVPLEIIEVQNGEYVGEDDIVRMEDVYGR